MNANKTKLVAVLEFHGINLPLLKYEDVEYVPLRPLSDVACLNWRTTQVTALTPENVRQFGTKSIPRPVIALLCEQKTPSKADSRSVKATESDVDSPDSGLLCIRKDQSRAWMMSINTARMRSMGKEDAADHWLALKIEWGKVLDAYESRGFAAKPGAIRDLAQLINASKSLSLIACQRKRAAASQALDLMFEQLGITVPPEPQTELPLEA